LTVSRRYAGKLVRCPKCGEKTRIPSLETIEQKLKEQQAAEEPANQPLPESKLIVAASGEETAPPRAIMQRRPKERRLAETASPAPQRTGPALPLAPPAPASPEIDDETNEQGPPPVAIAAPPVAEAGPPFEPLPDSAATSIEAPPVVTPWGGTDVESPPIESPRIESPPIESSLVESLPLSAAPVVEAAPSRPAEATVSETPADTPIRGYRPEPERRWTCVSFGIALALVGAFGAVPAVLEIAEYARSDGAVPVARWAWLALLTAAVQIAYAVYAAQLPDWSTAWVVTLVGASLATFYAFLLGLTWVAGESSSIVALLQLTDQVPEGKATRWCFAMLGILGVYAYFAGRSALRWRHAFQLTRPMKEAKQL
jgi:hypothetical protein